MLNIIKLYFQKIKLKCRHYLNFIFINYNLYFATILKGILNIKNININLNCVNKILFFLFFYIFDKIYSA